MVFPVFVYDVAVDTALLVFGDEEGLRLSDEVGEVVVGVYIIYNVGAVAVLHREVDHIFAGVLVVDGLWRPYALEVVMSFVALLYVDHGRLPVDEVGRFEQCQAAVGVPSLVAGHVGHYHIELLAVFAAEDMGVAHASRFADEFRVDYRGVVVEGLEVESVAAERIVDSVSE